MVLPPSPLFSSDPAGFRHALMAGAPDGVARDVAFFQTGLDEAGMLGPLRENDDSLFAYISYSKFDNFFCEISRTLSQEKAKARK